MIAESKDAESFRFDSLGALGVSPFSVDGKVLTAVKFDDKFGRVTNEIRHIILNWGLAPESSSA